MSGRKAAASYKAGVRRPGSHCTCKGCGDEFQIARGWEDSDAGKKGLCRDCYIAAQQRRYRTPSPPPKVES